MNRTMTAVLLALPVSAIAADLDGKAVYEQVCAACHATGDKGAPKTGDAKAWKKLIREGFPELATAALAGIRQMPPKGGNPALSDLEVGRAVAYLANAAGARFAEPDAAQMAPLRVKADRRLKRRQAETGK